MTYEKEWLQLTSPENSLNAIDFNMFKYRVNITHEFCYHLSNKITKGKIIYTLKLRWLRHNK